MQNSIPAAVGRLDYSRFDNLYIIQKPADLRKGIDGYCSIISGILSMDPADGSLYLFTNRARNKVKAVFYDGTGFWLLYKRLNSSSLKWPVSANKEDVLRVEPEHLESLLQGLSIMPSPDFLPSKPLYV